MPIGDHVFIVEPSAGKTIELSGWQLQFKVWGEGTGGRLSVTEQVMQPGRLVPPHVHKRQDELSYVLEGTFGVRVGDRIGKAGPGSYFFKPRDVPHTCWNVGPGPARMIEIMWPGGLDRVFFERLAAVRSAAVAAGTGTGLMELAERLSAELSEEHDFQFLPDWVPELRARYHLRLLDEP
jgi:mannose-6-phosphate isomerase-like protein (cupin superfamily)